MTERRRLQNVIYNINIHTLQYGDTHVENRTETHIVDSSIGQLNIQQDPSTEKNEEAHVIQEVKEQNPTTSNKTPVKSERKSGEYKDQNAAKNEEALVIIQKVRKQDPTTSVPTSVNSEQKSGDDKDQNAAKNEEAPVLNQEVIESNPTTSVQTSGNSNRKRKKYQEKKLLDQNYTDENPKKKNNSVQCELLTVHAATLCGETKFTDAESVLKKLTGPYQGDVGVSALLLLAEVSVHLERKEEANKAMRALECLPIESLADIYDWIEHASDLISHKSFVRALVLLRISSDINLLHESLSSPDDIVKVICKRVDKIDEVVRPMIKSGHQLKMIALKYGLPYMVEKMNDLKDVKDARPPNIALQLAYYYNRVGFNYDLSNEYDKSIEFRKCGVDKMISAFHDKASKYRIYGDLLNNLGDSHQSRLNNFGDSHQSFIEYEYAENYFNEAIEAYKIAANFGDEGKKQKEIDITTNSLKILHATFKKVSPKHID